MVFSKSCVYGIRALLYLAMENQRNFVPIKEISEKLNISFHFLTKILQNLTQHELVISFKGPKGGVSLARKADEISILDIVAAIDGSDIFSRCLLDLPGCSIEKPCPLHIMWGQIRENLRMSLQRAVLLNLAKEIRNGEIRLYEAPVLRE